MELIETCHAFILEYRLNTGNDKIELDDEEYAKFEELLSTVGMDLDKVIGQIQRKQEHE